MWGREAGSHLPQTHGGEEPGRHGISAAISSWDDASAAGPLRSLFLEGEWRVARAKQRNGNRRLPIFAYHESAQFPRHIEDVLMRGPDGSGASEDVEWRVVSISDGSGPGDPSASIVADVWARRSSQEILFDFRSSSLLRRFYEPLRTDYAALRADYAAFVSSPDFVTVGSAEVKESIVAGLHIDMVEEPERLSAVRGLLLEMAALVAERPIPDATIELTRLEQALETSPIKEAMERRAEILSIFGRDGGVPLVASAGDLKSHNLMLDGARAFVIDFEWLEPRPFWHDAFEVARRACPQALADGRLNEELRTLFAAAEVSPGRGVHDWIRLSVLSATVLKGWKRGKRGRSGRRRLSRSDARWVRRRWSEEQSRLAYSD